MKTCVKCGIKKEVSEFPESIKTNVKYKTKSRLKVCYECRLQSQNNKEYFKKWREKNRTKALELQKKWRIKNKERIKEYSFQYRLKNAEMIKVKNRKWANDKKINDPMFKLTSSLRTRMYHFLQSNKIKKHGRTFDIIGCTSEQLKKYLETKFKEGMSWENYGKLGWHVDHIIPLSSSKNDEEANKLCHFTNLQPLWGKENWSKGNKISKHDPPSE